MLSTIKQRASKKDLPFDLEAEDIIPPARCPVLGIPLERSEGGSSPNSPSVDRLIPELGYVKGNVQVISQKANAIKQNASPEEIRAVADWMEEQLLCPSSS